MANTKRRRGSFLTKGKITHPHQKRINELQNRLNHFSEILANPDVNRTLAVIKKLKEEIDYCTTMIKFYSKNK